MTSSSLWPRISTTLTNAYYVYSSSCDFVQYSKRMHRLFSVVDMINCLDFFPAADRLKTAWKRFRETDDKFYPLCKIISESTGMFSDVYWFVDELKKWNIVSISSFVLVKPIYTIVSPFQYLWLLDSIHNTWRICRLSYDFTQPSHEKTKQYVLGHFSEFQDRFSLPGGIRQKLVESSGSLLEKTINELSRAIFSTWALDTATTLTNVCYYSLSAIQCISPQSATVSVLLLACSVTSLAIGILF